MRLPPDALHLDWKPCDIVRDLQLAHVAYRGHVLHWWWGMHCYCVHHAEAPAPDGGRSLGGRSVSHNPCSLSVFRRSVACYEYRTLAEVDAHIDAQRVAYSPDSALIRLDR